MIQLYRNHSVLWNNLITNSSTGLRKLSRFLYEGSPALTDTNFTDELNEISRIRVNAIKAYNIIS